MQVKVRCAGASEAASEASASSAVVNPGDVVLVAGATGGVGQVLTKKLVEVRCMHVPNHPDVLILKQTY